MRNSLYIPKYGLETDSRVIQLVGTQLHFHLIILHVLNSLVVVLVYGLHGLTDLSEHNPLVTAS